MQRLGLGFVFAAAVVACTADNPLYNPDRADDLAVTGDLAGVVDLAGKPGAPDLATPTMTCSGDQRGCTTTGSERCDNGMLVLDRTCPTGSTCMSGACQPPPLGAGTIGKNCAPLGTPSEPQCIFGGGGGGGASAPSCQPFVTSAAGMVTWVCAPPVGNGASGTACTSGAQCRSGFCGSNGTCFRACASAFDCPQGGIYSCDSVAIVVDGQSIQAKSCIKH